MIFIIAVWFLQWVLVFDVSRVCQQFVCQSWQFNFIFLVALERIGMVYFVVGFVRKFLEAIWENLKLVGEDMWMACWCMCSKVKGCIAVVQILQKHKPNWRRVQTKVELASSWSRNLATYGLILLLYKISRQSVKSLSCVLN